MKAFPVFAVIVALMLGIAACKKDSVVEPTTTPTNGLPVHIIGNVLSDGLGTGRFTYYRLSDSSIVPFSDSNSTRWDIAFRSTTIHINAGSSGPGLGGLQRLTGTLFDTVATLPTGGYLIDSVSGPALKTGSGNGWYNYNFTTNIVTPLPGVVLFVKTGDGKFAKVEILNYYKDAPASLDTNSISRYYKFRYVYQPNGTNLLK